MIDDLTDEVKTCVDTTSFDVFQMAFLRIKEAAKESIRAQQALKSVHQEVAGNTSQRILPPGFKANFNITKAQFVRFKRAQKAKDNQKSSHNFAT